MGFYDVFDQILGLLRQHRLLVCFTERRARLRIFSARPATRKERQDYERHTNL